jgi:hypothetical protein
MKLTEQLKKEIRIGRPLKFGEAVKPNSVLGGYLEALLWASNDDEDEPLDSNYSISDISKDAIKASEKDIAKFQKMARVELEGIEADDSQIGHDIFLSRNGHGAGFFDRDYADQKILDKLQGLC